MGFPTEVLIIGAGPAGLAAAIAARKERILAALGEFPELADSLRNAELSSMQRGAVTATCRLDSVCRHNIALFGDASGSVDAITGEGLG